MSSWSQTSNPKLCLLPPASLWRRHANEVPAGNAVRLKWCEVDCALKLTYARTARSSALTSSALTTSGVHAYTVIHTRCESESILGRAVASQLSTVTTCAESEGRFRVSCFAALQKLAGGRGCNFIFSRFFLNPCCLFANSAQVQNKWPELCAGMWESQESWRGWVWGRLQWELSHFLTALSRWQQNSISVSLQCSLSKLKQKWGVLFFFFYCYSAENLHSSHASCLLQ